MQSWCTLKSGAQAEVWLGVGTESESPHDSHDEFPGGLVVSASQLQQDDGDAKLKTEMEGLEDHKNARFGSKPRHVNRCAIHFLVSMLYLYSVFDSLGKLQVRKCESDWTCDAISLRLAFGLVHRWGVLLGGAKAAQMSQLLVRMRVKCETEAQANGVLQEIRSLSKMTPSAKSNMRWWSCSPWFQVLAS
jgi:hypothetical protein